MAGFESLFDEFISAPKCPFNGMCTDTCRLYNELCHECQLRVVLDAIEQTLILKEE